MSIPRPPIIDFARTKQSRVGGLVLAAAGIAALAGAALQAQESQAALVAQREGLRNLVSQTPGGRSLVLSPEERRRRQQMEVVANYLAAPWDGLLAAFEARAKGKVVVRKLEPDAATGMVRMVGETQNIRAMMDYVQALETDKRLHEVVLLKHERVQENGGAQPGAPAIPGAPGSGGASTRAAGAEGSAPIEFTVVAAWRLEGRQAIANAGNGNGTATGAASPAAEGRSGNTTASGGQP